MLTERVSSQKKRQLSHISSTIIRIRDPKVKKVRHSVILSSKEVMIPLIALCIILLIFAYVSHKFFSSGIEIEREIHYPKYFHDRDDANKWVPFGGYAGLPFYFIKKGKNENSNHIKDLITLTTFCDINLLYEAQKIAKNYKSGPISISVFIDDDYHNHLISKNGDAKLKNIFDAQLANISNEYDINIGLLYNNISSPVYQSKGFLPNTPLSFRLPMNPLRNLAEYGLNTEWVFNIDVDFWYLSESFNQNVAIFMDEMKEIINVYGEKSIFIIPSFEILTQNDVKYESMKKTELREAIDANDVLPFHFNHSKNAQQCTNYHDWYKAEQNEKLNHMQPEDECSLFYEPWYIMKTSVSRNELYKWNNVYVGRGYSKVARVQNLRYHCFNFFVMSDLFIIHAAKTLHIAFNQTLRNEWTGKNRDLLIGELRTMMRDKDSCLAHAAPFAVKVTYFLRSVLFGFGQIAWNYIKNI